ncbi:MAG TPA: hypothetical protein VI653_30245, partial [Steroidobacteraceae bacterium]
DKTPMFDVDEYLHLAIHASSVGNHHACMGYLKEVLQQQPANALALHLLATEHAEIGLYERAIKGMRAALAIDTGLEMVRLQLGMLLLDRRRPAEAKVELGALAGSRDKALRAYSEAMIALSDNKLSLAREALTKGLSVPGANPSLQGIMRQVFERLAKSEEAAPSSPPPATAEAAVTREELFLGAYRQGTN